MDVIYPALMAQKMNLIIAERQCLKQNLVNLARQASDVERKKVEIG